MTKNDETLYETLSKNVAASLDAPPEPQDYLDLDAGGYLLVALGHLVKAREKLAEEPLSRAVWSAIRYARYATNYVRYALKRLDELKEETCEKSSRP